MINDLWERVEKLYKDGNSGEALFILYSDLHDNKDNFEMCDEFLLKGMSKNMSSDIIVHILNALCCRRNNYKNWDKFVEYCTELLNKQVGAEVTIQLLGVIV